MDEPAPMHESPAVHVGNAVSQTHLATCRATTATRRLCGPLCCRTLEPDGITLNQRVRQRCFDSFDSAPPFGRIAATLPDSSRTSTSGQLEPVRVTLVGCALRKGRRGTSTRARLNFAWCARVPLSKRRGRRPPWSCCWSYAARDRPDGRSLPRRPRRPRPPGRQPVYCRTITNRQFGPPKHVPSTRLKLASAAPVM